MLDEEPSGSNNKADKASVFQTQDSGEVTSSDIVYETHDYFHGPWIQVPIKEFYDDKVMLKNYPLVPNSQYPKSNKVMSFLNKEGLFSFKRGFFLKEIINGKYYYIITCDFTRRFIKWLKNSTTELPENYLAIDNSYIFNGERSLKTKDCQVVTEKLWKELIQWFGGGVELKIRCVQGNISPELILVRVISQKENGKFKRFCFNPLESVLSAKKVICEFFNVEPHECRLHDFYRYEPYIQLDTNNELHTKLLDMRLSYDNILFLEFPHKNGKYRIKYSRKKIISDSIHGENQENGVVGLSNLGNTCYMNSILQCLSNLPYLKHAFLSKNFEIDINLENVLGYKGQVAKAFYNVIRVMWSGKGSYVRPEKFRKAITTAKPDFAGFEQHDSQEFLSSLLDAIHEDLNRIVKKPITSKVEAHGRPDLEVANESLATYKARNESIITDLFLGLYKSTVTCPIESCNNISVTFDPFMIIPLPLQMKQSHYQVLQVVYVPRNPKEAVQRIRVIAPKHGPCFILRAILKDKFGINKKNEQDIEKGKPDLENLDEEIMGTQGFPDTDPAIFGKRDLLIFHAVGNKLNPYPYTNNEPLSSFNQSSVILCYETFDTLQFEYFCFSPSELWLRKLQINRPPSKKKNPFRRYQSPNLDNNDYDDISDSEKEYEELFFGDKNKNHVGELNCPFLIGDLWHGEYSFKEYPQHIRLEILKVDKMDWLTYKSYKAEIISYYGDLDHSDTLLTKESFHQHEVFDLWGIADTKVQYNRGHVPNTAFEMRGVYIYNKQQVVGKSLKFTKFKSKSENYSKPSHKTKSSKKKKKNSSKRNLQKKKNQNKLNETHKIAVVLHEEEEDMYKLAKGMRAGQIEESFVHGHYVLRPTPKRKLLGARKRQQPGYASIEEDPEEREAIILIGFVEKLFRYTWGKFQVDQGFTKGEFSMQIFETNNWKHHSGINTAFNAENTILNYTRYSLPSNKDNRVLIMLCHREARSFVGIPEAFFVPNEISEAETMALIRRKLVFLYKQEFLRIVTRDNSKHTDLNEVKAIVNKIEIMRVDYKFNHKPKRGDDLGTGEVLDSYSDNPLRIGDEFIVWLMVIWPNGYPFENSRPTKCLRLLQSYEEKMTLQKALNLFQKTDKLSAMNAWYCNKCKKHQEAFKQLQIWSLPKILVVQFKRFSQDEGRSKADKLEIPVDFPFSLNLEDVTLSSKVVQLPAQTLSQDIEKTNCFLSSYDYELVAVSSHVGGGLGFGHYIACAKNEITGKWYEFDDDRVTEIGKDFYRIVNPQAYVLFYVNKVDLGKTKKHINKIKSE